MRILVFSDSHGNISNMLDAVEIETPCLIIHLGDNDGDCTDIIRMYPDIPLRQVRGNSNRSVSGLDIDEVVLNGKRFLITHGHLFGVKTGKMKLINDAIDRGVDVLLFGHTHVPFYSVTEGITVINPGSIGSNAKSYAVLEIKDGEITCELKHL